MQALRLSELSPASGAVLRDAAVTRTGFVGRGGGPALVRAESEGWLARALAAPATAAVVVPPALAPLVPAPVGVVVSEAPEIDFLLLHARLAEAGMRAPVVPGRDPDACVHPAAVVEEGCRLGPGVIVEAGAVIHAGTILEEGVRIGSNAVIGGDGRMIRRAGGGMVRAPHVGGVRIGAGTEIHSGVVIQREVFADFTEIGPRCVIVSGCRIAHGVRMGEGCDMALGAQVSGYATLGDRVWIGPGAVVSSLIEIGDDARVEIGAVVVRSIPAGSRYSGVFARPHDRMRAISKAAARLADEG